MAARAKLFPVAVACGMAGALAAQESEAPDLSFLEYLGSWDEGDEEWLMFEGLLDDGYEVEVDESVLQTDDAVAAREREDAAVANDADEAGDPDESGESNDDQGTDEVAAADAD
jgi:hypothetical protein